MKQSSEITVFIVLVLLSACGCDGGGSTEPGLRFTAIPDQNTTELEEKFRPVAEYLAEQLGVAVEYVPAADYQASVEMFKNGDVHLAWFGGLTGVQARNAVKGARAIAQGEEDPEYMTYFIAHKSAGLTPGPNFPRVISHFSFTFGSESSTSGRLMPEWFILQNTGKSPLEFFEQKPGFSGSHDKTVELVESGKYEVGAVSFKVYEKRVQAGKTDPEICRVIWKTPTYADYNFTAHPDLDKHFGAGCIDRLQKALVAMTAPALLNAFPRKRLIAAKNEDYSGLEKVAKDLGFLK